MERKKEQRRKKDCGKTKRERKKERQKKEDNQKNIMTDRQRVNQRCPSFSAPFIKRKIIFLN